MDIHNTITAHTQDTASMVQHTGRAMAQRINNQYRLLVLTLRQRNTRSMRRSTQARMALMQTHTDRINKQQPQLQHMRPDTRSITTQLRSDLRRHPCFLQT